MKKRHWYLLQRLGLTLISLWAVITLLFFLFRVVPGNPASVLASPQFSEADQQALLEQYGLTKPLHVQYALYMKNFVVGDWGLSFKTSQPVLPFILNKALNTVMITVPAVVMAFIVGPFLGASFAWRRNEALDDYGTAAVLAAYGAPIFWTGMLGLMIFSYRLGWLPTSGMHSITFTADGLVDRYANVDFLKHALLPIAIFFFWRLSQPTLLMRNNMIDVLGSDYIDLKRAEGISDRKIQFKHAMRNAMLPVVHYGALALGFAFGGSVVLETVFSWPGLGRAMWQAVLSSNYPVAQGAFFFLALIIMSMNLFADLISVYIDPRAAEGEIE